MSGGVVQLDLDANGRGGFAHGLGQTPNYVYIAPAAGVHLTVESCTDTDVRVVAVDTATCVPKTNCATAIEWMARP